MFTTFWKAASGKSWLIALGAILSAVAFVRADDEIDIDRDVLHTVAARRALYQDAQLAPLNLGVKVRNRVAVLWGPIPSLELARRAVEVLKALPELVAVQSELEIVPDDDRPLFLPEAGRLPAGPAGTLTTRTTDNGTKASPPIPSGWRANAGGKKDPRIPDDSEIELVLPSLRVPIPPMAEQTAKTAEEAIRDLQKQRRFARLLWK